jgi:hypothetical protein
MDKCIKITGGIATAAHGLTALTEAGQLTSVGNCSVGTGWRPMAQVTLPTTDTGKDQAKDAAPGADPGPTKATASATDQAKPAPALGISGNNANGIVIYSGKQLRYLGSVDTLQAEWINLPSSEIDIAGMVGERVTGITVFSAAVPASGSTPKQDSVVAQMLPPTDDNKLDWKRKTAPPFDVSLIAGDSVGGVLILGVADGMTSLAKSGPDCNCDWKKLPSLLFKVQMATGDATNGYVFAGAGQMVSLDAKGVVTKLPLLNFGITAMTGNPKDGIAAILEGGVIAVCTDLSKGAWTVLGGPISAAAAPAAVPATVPSNTSDTTLVPATPAAPKVPVGSGASKAASSVTVKEVEPA